MAEPLIVGLADLVVSAVSFDTRGVRTTKKFESYVAKNGTAARWQGKFYESGSLIAIDDDTGEVIPRMEVFKKPSDSLQK